jgi:radical SAM enzyme (TIGR01210 family)
LERIKTLPYPEGSRERSRWIVAHRENSEPAARDALDSQRPYAFLLEDERAASGEIVPTATVFLTNRECPWRCLMCDLWRNTLTQTVAAGAIPNQIDYALARLAPARQIKLYNSGSFFDRRAIPVADYKAIAMRLHAFERVIVESHPSLIGDDCLRLRNLLKGRLEVAMGLETVHPVILPRLNKGMTLDQFSSAATRLREYDIALRVFILVKPPFLNEAEALYWAQRSLDFAFDCGATVAALIPTRFGNGAMEALASRGEFSPPKLSTLESALSYGIGLKRGRVFADLWDLERFSDCSECFLARSARLCEMNMRQEIVSPVLCQSCGDNNE